MTRRFWTGAAIAGVLAAAGISAAPIASASPAGQEPAMAGSVAQYCAVDLQTQKFACAESESQAAHRAGVGPQAVAAVTLYDGFNYTSPLYTAYVPAPCTPGYEGEYGVPNLGTYSNRASSVKTFNRCDVHLHDPINYGTPYSVWIDQSANLANIGNGWNNRASSLGIS